MYDENLHIIPDPKKGFPEPDVPADEAWNRMAGLLDAEMPVQPPEPPAPSGSSVPSAGGIFGGGLKLWIIGAGIVVITGALIWGILQYTGETETSTLGTEQIRNALNSPEAPSNISGDHKAELQTADDEEERNAKLIREEITIEDVTIEDVTIEDVTIEDLTIGDRTIEDVTIEDRTKTERDKMGGGEERFLVTESKTVTAPESRTEDGAAGGVAPNVPDTSFTQPVDQVPVRSDTSGVVPPQQPAPGWNEPASPQDEDGKVKKGGDKPKEKGGSRGQRNDNLEWYMAINGNAGEVLQNERKPNPYFGGMLTAGLWDNRMEAGLETGIGWEECRDYGSVVTSLRIDSIPVDTLGHVTYIDTTNIQAYTYHYQYLQVPLFVTKQLFNTRNFSLDLKTGPLVGFMISDSQTLDHASGPGEGQVLGTEDKTYARLKLSWQWQLMPQFRWKIRDKLYFTLSPACTFYLNNLYEKDDRPAGIPVGIGVYGGLMYRF